VAYANELAYYLTFRYSYLFMTVAIAASWWCHWRCCHWLQQNVLM